MIFSGMIGVLLGWIAWGDFRKGLIYNQRLIFLLLVLCMEKFYGGFPDVLDCSAGFVLGGGLLWLLRWFSRGGIGAGDIKFAAVLGFWLGIQGILLTLAAAFMSGGFIAAFLWKFLGWKRDQRIPFGPFLAGGAYVVFCYGELLWKNFNPLF